MAFNYLPKKNWAQRKPSHPNGKANKELPPGFWSKRICWNLGNQVGKVINGTSFPLKPRNLKGERTNYLQRKLEKIMKIEK